MAAQTSPKLTIALTLYMNAAIFGKSIKFVHAVMGRVARGEITTEEGFAWLNDFPDCLIDGKPAKIGC